MKVNAIQKCPKTGKYERGSFPDSTCRARNVVCLLIGGRALYQILIQIQKYVLGISKTLIGWTWNCLLL